MTKRNKPIPKADSVQWVGLCPCGCEGLTMMLLDKDGDPIATFGFGRLEWLEVIAFILKEGLGDEGETKQ